jgi:peptidoglycan hydrolase-like protein with peptidoglycan-binding domain
MKSGKFVLTAIALSSGIGLGVQSVSAQYVPEAGQRGGGIPEKMQSPAQSDRSTSSSRVSSDDIKNAKEALKAKGIDPGPINGTMDSKTQQALRQFQQANNLPVTGTLDQATATKLGVTLGSAGGSSGASGSSREGSSGNVSESSKGDSPARPGSSVKPEGPSAKERE